MKLKPEQLMYVRSMGKALQITAIFTDADEANRYMARPGLEEGVVAEFGPYIILAAMYDKGIDLPARAAVEKARA